MRNKLFFVLFAFLCFIVNTVNIFASNNLNTYTLDDGKKYDVYTPSNVGANTPLIINSTSIDSAAYPLLSKAIIDSNINAIVVVPKLTWLPADEYKSMISSIIENLSSKYGLSNKEYIANGYSQQAHTAIKAMVNYLKEHPNADRQLVLLNDGIPLQEGDNGPIELLTDDDIATLEKNNTLIIDYCQKDYYTDKGYLQQTWKNVGNKLLNSSLDLLFISDNELPSNEFWTNHNFIYYSSYSSGIFDKVLFFVYKGQMLPQSGYIYRFYNHNTKELNEYSASNLAKKMQLSPDNVNNTTKTTRRSEQTKTTNNVIELPKTFCEDEGVLKMFKIMGKFLVIVKVLLPLIIIVLSSIDFFKLLINNNSDNLKEAGIKLVRRLVAGILIFFVPTILNVILSFVDDNINTNSEFTNCTTCLFNPSNCNELISFR